MYVNSCAAILINSFLHFIMDFQCWLLASASCWFDSARESFAIFNSTVLAFTIVSNLLFHEKSRKTMINATPPITVTINIVKYCCWTISAPTSVARLCCALTYKTQKILTFNYDRLVCNSIHFTVDKNIF